MATRAKKAAAVKAKAAEPGRKMVVSFPTAAEPAKAEAMAKMAVRASVNAAAVMVSYTSPLGEQDLGALVDSLSAGMGELEAGEMNRAEAMLYGQAHALQAIFMNLARRAAGQEYLPQWDAFLRMALKAQNQCRMTLETLATIKNPPVVFARQANINNGGQQQVNNGAPTNGQGTTAGFSQASDSVPEQTGLLEAIDGQGLDTGAASTTGRADPDMATVGPIDRAEVDRGQGTDGSQRRQGRRVANRA